MQTLRSLLRARYVILGIWLVSILAVYWLLPEGTLYIGNPAPTPDTLTISEQDIPYPNIEIDPPHPEPGQTATVIVSDNVAWPYIDITVTGSQTEFLRSSFDEQRKIWVWRWSFIAPAQTGYEVAFYHDCDTGCIQRIRTQIGKPNTTSSALLSTKLGVVFANPERDWHGWSGWDVELTYALEADNGYWGIDALAERVQNIAGQGLKVLVRVDYAPNQTLPPSDDYPTLTVYLDYLRRLARDDRLKGVYGYVIGSGFNAQGSNSQSPDHLITPEWYARVFNGYGEDPRRSDNVVETIRLENPAVRVLVGPVRPWIFDQDGQKKYTIDAPWLNYMNTLVAAINDAVEENIKLGIARSGPDGFALHVPGRPDATTFGGQLHADEPRLDLLPPDWKGAQAGFRVYRDWLDIINAYSHTRNLPAFITSTNTSTPDKNVPPADNYPRGWLTSALEVVNGEPQIQALCWFIDRYDSDDKWARFRLTEPTGLSQDAADEFDALLRLEP